VRHGNTRDAGRLSHFINAERLFRGAGFLRGGMKCDQEWDGLAAEGVEYSPAGGEDVGNPADIAVFFEGCAAFAAADIHFYVVVGHAFELRNEPARTAFEARVFEFAEDAVVERDGAVEFDELADLVLE